MGFQPEPKNINFIDAGKKVLRIERECLEQLEEFINQQFATACEMMFHCSGKIVVMGMERIVPTFEEMEVLVSLLTRSSVGQRLTSYVTLLTGPGQS